MTAAAIDRIRSQLNRDMLLEPVLSSVSAQALLLQALVDARKLGQQDATHPLPRTLEVALGKARRELGRRLCNTQDSYGEAATHVIHEETERLARAALAIGRDEAAHAVQGQQRMVDAA